MKMNSARYAFFPLIVVLSFHALSFSPSRKFSVFKAYMSDSDMPSDSSGDYLNPGSGNDIKSELLQLTSKSDRGSLKDDSYRVKLLIESLESLKKPLAIDTSNLLMGTWELIWSDDDVTRSSPFFWAFRKATKGLKDPVGLLGPELLSESIFKITDSIPFKSVGKSQQTFIDNILRSEVEVEIGLKSLMTLGSSLMTTSSFWSQNAAEPDVLELRVDKVNDV